ncbi:MAG: DNA-binding CsgD family transcriptional regulator [Bradyrhizobium sp.]|jgi:DNA-binding CsgD family transcriptional regulator
MEISSRLILDIYDGSQHFSPSEFNEYALNTAKKIVHFDSAVIADFNIAKNKKLTLQALHLHSVPLERLQDRPSTVGAETVNHNGALSSRDDVLKNAFRQRGASIVVDIAKNFSEPGILKYCRKYETDHSLAFVSRETINEVVPTIALWRAGKKKAYSEDHAGAATLLFPYILQAREINIRLTQAPMTGLHRSTTVMATLDGCLYFVSQEAIRLLQLEWKQWSPPLLPSVLIDSLKKNQERMFVGTAISVNASVEGNMICLIIAARTNSECRLTRAEYLVARLAAEGLQYKEIARELDVSPATVRNQLHSAYRKLGVSNKTALAAALPS